LSFLIQAVRSNAHPGAATLRARARKLHISDGLYRKALVTGIDAPPDPKVSHYLGKAAIVSGGSSGEISCLSLRNAIPYVKWNAESSVSWAIIYLTK